MRNEVCYYYLCPWESVITEDQNIIREGFTGRNGTYHIDCFVKYLHEIHEDMIEMEVKRRK